MTKSTEYISSGNFCKRTLKVPMAQCYLKFHCNRKFLEDHENHAKDDANPLTGPPFRVIKGMTEQAVKPFLGSMISSSNWKQQVNV